MNKISFILLQFVLVLVLVISLTINTFSWATRPDLSGNDLTLNFSTQINGNSVNAGTYLGTMDTDTEEISYSSEAITGHTETNAVAGQIVYFKTVFTNSSPVDTNISLLLKSISVTDGASVKIGVTSPTKEFFEVTSDAIAQGWIPVVNTFEVPAATVVGEGDGASTVSATREIIWYLEFTAAGSVTIDSFNVVYG